MGAVMLCHSFSFFYSSQSKKKNPKHQRTNSSTQTHRTQNLTSDKIQCLSLWSRNDNNDPIQMNMEEK